MHRQYAQEEWDPAYFGYEENGYALQKRSLFLSLQLPHRMKLYRCVGLNEFFKFFVGTSTSGISEETTLIDYITMECIFKYTTKFAFTDRILY